MSGLVLQGFQGVAGLIHNRGGHAGQARHLDAVAAAGRAALDFMQKDDVAPGLGGADVHIDGCMVRGRESGQLEVMRGKQGVGLGLVVQLAGNGRGQRQTVEGAGATAYFIHQHQRVGCGAVQDLRSFQHFQHEGGLGIGQIVSGADAGVDGVNRSETTSRSRHVAADAGQHHDDCDLAHIGRLAAHVGTGDDLHALLGTEPCVVGNESPGAGFIQAHLHHRMPAGLDLQAGLTRELRRTPVQCQGALAQRAQRVQRGQGTRQLRQARYEGLQLIEQFLKQILFPGQGALLRAQRLVFKGLQLGRDEAFCVLQRLAAPVVSGHLVKLTLRDLDEKAVHLVVLHAQIGNAGARLFTRLDVQQKGVGVALNRAQLIQFGVKPVGYDAAVAQQRGGFGIQCA